jgi:hypothetical protein
MRYVGMLMLLIWCTAANSTVYNVDKSGAGNYTTIAGAVAVAQAGDTVYVKAGTYNETITTQRAGTNEIGRAHV